MLVVSAVVVVSLVVVVSFVVVFSVSFGSFPSSMFKATALPS